MSWTKLEKDGKVAVLVSYGYGAGWSTWAYGDKEAMCMDSELVQAVLDENQVHLLEIAELKYPDEYKGGLNQLKVEWVPKGTQFEITEYDGFEGLETLENKRFFQA